MSVLKRPSVHFVPTHLSRFRPLSKSKSFSIISASANGGGNSSPEGGASFPTAMSLSDAYVILGLKEGSSSYESVLDAKNRLLDRYEGQMEKKLEIETAYDVIFSQQLKARLSGDLPVSNKVRFADVSVTRRQLSSSPGKQLMNSRQLSAKSLVGIRPLSGQPTLTVAGVYGLLAAWTLAQGIMMHPTLANTTGADSPGLQLALGTATAVYFLREYKKINLAKAGGFALAGLVVGTLIGGGIESWLRVDLVPIGSLSSPSTVVGEFALAGLWTVAMFLA